MRQYLTISVQEARRFMLTHLLLTGEKSPGAREVIKVFKRLKCIQFDPLSIAGRNHDIVLQARIRDYKPSVCVGLLYKERQLLDAWDKKMAIMRTADWPYFTRLHNRLKERLGNPEGQIYPILDHVRAQVRERGPVTAASLNISGEADWWFGVGNWGSPNLGRVALEAMVSWGELVIADKKRGRKSYDFAEKLLPKEIISSPDPFSSVQAHNEWLVLRRVSSAGLIRKGQSSVWMDSYVLTPKSRNDAISHLLQNGQLLEIHAEGIKTPFLACTADWARYKKEPFRSDEKLRFIAPLDNLMWDRTLVSALFGMDYHWEVYEPPHKRKYGYYVLPVLKGDELIGRVEPVLKKGDRAMKVKGFWLEQLSTPGAKTRKIGKIELARALEEYARFLGAGDYTLEY